MLKPKENSIFERFVRVSIGIVLAVAFIGAVAYCIWIWG